MPANNISLDKAKQNKLFYFVANVIIVKDGKCLLLKRSDDEKVHPGKWCVPGGKLEWDDLDITHPTRMNGEVYDFEDALEDLLAREAKEESGITIETRSLHYINSVAFVRPDGVPVMMTKVCARYLSGDITIEQGAFTDYAWVTAGTVDAYDCIQGIPQEIKQALDRCKD